MSNSSEGSWVCFEDGVLNRDKTKYSEPGDLGVWVPMLLLLEFCMLILIYSHLMETCKLSSSKFRYVVLLLGILKSVMWERHTLGGPFKDDTDNKFFNQWQSSFYAKALILV